MQRIAANLLTNPQQLTATVTGPDGANTLIALTGQFPAGVGVFNGNQRQTYSVLLGPVITRRQFVQAIATASFAGLNSNGTGGVQWTIENVDADWDDESGQVELRVEVSVWAGAASNSTVVSLGYQVTMLAQT